MMYLPGLPNDNAVGELGDEGPLLLKDDDEELSDTLRKSNDGEPNFGELGRLPLFSKDPTFLSELVLLNPAWLLRRPNRFQNGRCFVGVFSTSGVEGR